MKLFRWLIFLLSLSVEVRVKALVQEPVNCLSQKKVACSLFADKKFNLATKNFKLMMVEGSILHRNSLDDWNLVGGTIRIETEREIRFFSRVGAFILAPGTKWLQWKNDKLWIYSVRGEVSLRLMSSTMATNSIPEGFFNWIGLVGRDGQNEQGILQRLAPEVAKARLPGLAAYRDLSMIQKWESRGVAMASDFYQEVAQTVTDQISEQERRAEAREQFNIRQERRIHEMFRQKYFSPVELPESEQDQEESPN